MTKLNKLKQEISKKFDPLDWELHILSVVKYAKQLNKKYKVNPQTLELAAVLHDIGRAQKQTDDTHHITGVPMAKKILTKYNYPEEVINEVLHCVESHRTSKGPAPKTMTAKIIANADAMSHFDMVPIFFYWRARRGDTYKNIYAWVKNKLAKDWQKKLTLPEAKKIIKPKYDKIKGII